MRPDALIPLVGAIVNFSLAVFVLFQNPRSTVSRVFFLLGTGFAVWNYGTYWMFLVTNERDALFWARFLNFGVIWIPITIFHLSFLIAGFKIPRRTVVLAYSLQIILTLLNFTPLVVEGVKNVGYAWYTVGGPLYYVLFVIFGLAWVSVFVLWKHRKKLPLLMRRRLTPLLVAQAAISFFGQNDALPILGRYYYPFTNYQVYPFGSMAVIFYGMIVGYSVLQHQLLNVHVVLGRYAAQVVRMMFLFCIGFCMLLVVAAFTKEFTTTTFLASLGVLVASAIVASTVFPKILGGGMEKLERRLLGDQFEYQDQVRRFLQTMSLYTEMTRLREDLHTLLIRTFRLESYKLILREEVTHSFTLLQAHPDEPIRPLPEFGIDSAVFHYFEEGKREYLSLSDEHLSFPPSVMERRARAQLRHFPAEFCFPLIYHDEPLGLILTGRKVTGDPFTSTDVRLLAELAQNVSSVVNQIRLKTQIAQAQELDLLGRMSRGMAHDLNNLLTPISTLLQLTEETGIVDDELLPVATRNLASVRAYIREALFFSEHMRPDIQPARLDKLVMQAIEVAKNSRQKEVRIVPRVEDNVPAEIDGVLVQRLVANLLTNAIDASPAGAEILVTLERTARIDKDREWLRVRIQDRGEGIPRENLNRIFTPYYTTKNQGDRERGFGLGLAICRKIAALHGGNLSIESQLKRGTTVQLDIPSRPASVPFTSPANSASTPDAVPTAA